MSEISKNLEIVKSKIEDASRGRDVTLVGVSKYQPIELIQEAIDAGHRIFGENRMQELKEKAGILGSTNIDWHFIGAMQKNKVKYAKEDVKLIQSLDSVELAETMEKTFCDKKDVLIQVNIGSESQKSGISPENVHKYVAYFEKFGKINVIGLMCIPPKVENPKTYFMQMRDIFTSLQDAGHENIQILSMGMSADYELAIECGSNMVRVGTAIFGSRNI